MMLGRTAITPYKPVSPLGSPDFPIAHDWDKPISLSLRQQPQEPSPQQQRLRHLAETGALGAARSVEREMRSDMARPSLPDRVARMEQVMQSLMQMAQAQRPPAMPQEAPPRSPMMTFGAWADRNAPQFAGQRVPQAVYNRLYQQYVNQMRIGTQLYGAQARMYAARQPRGGARQQGSSVADLAQAYERMHGVLYPREEPPANLEALAARQAGRGRMGAARESMELRRGPPRGFEQIGAEGMTPGQARQFLMERKRAGVAPPAPARPLSESQVRGQLLTSLIETTKREKGDKAAQELARRTLLRIPPQTIIDELKTNMGLISDAVGEAFTMEDAVARVDKMLGPQAISHIRDLATARRREAQQAFLTPSTEDLLALTVIYPDEASVKQAVTRGELTNFAGRQVIDAHEILKTFKEEQKAAPAP